MAIRPAPQRNNRRRVLILSALLLFAAGGWGIYRWLHPTLTPVTVRILPANTGYLFSLGNSGYPAMETARRAPGAVDMRWLNAQGRPVSGTLERYRFRQFNVSPQRRVCARLYWSPSGIWTVRLTAAEGGSGIIHMRNGITTGCATCRTTAATAATTAPSSRGKDGAFDCLTRGTGR